ncbi:MAG TPA: hypothetical protein VKS79_07830 [Gemmataceae bacterium]|nr:hypothetical protein [Gemmataceae bacterium]
MPPLTAIAMQELASTPTQAAYCPICRGDLVDLRGLSRCTRCQFILCQACDGEQAEWFEGSVADD